MDKLRHFVRAVRGYGRRRNRSLYDEHEQIACRARLQNHLIVLKPKKVQLYLGQYVGQVLFGQSLKEGQLQ